MSASTPKATSVRISVKDQDGATLTGVRLLVSGTAGGGEYTTGAAGTAIVPIPKAGLFRVRCEREGFECRGFARRGCASGYEALWHLARMA